VLVVPIGVVTLTALLPVAAVLEMLQFAVTVVAVGVPVMAHVTRVPDTLTAVAPVRFVPVSVTGCGLVPVLEPEVGAIEVSVGPSTVNVAALLAPVGVETVTL
jgi:hypothetical protein